MMPAKLRPDVLRTLQSSARHGTQTLKNSNSLERTARTVSSFLPPILPGTFY
ncbi:ATV_HP_G0084460.mRNA.1.CDS.1 [Saccharomyces cerevisiae]|nr:ATV_HP_G0084460.mRNA.1.CDS.1 [Saccharomyces cerevisiae]CAI6445228.1 ATV_HP_G0084460.mRNA.1.CDS.1 [Saccharomyces cerevisiae]